MSPELHRPAAALTIAGSDPSGGAGIQADLKTFLCHGVYGAAALTALTAQDTTGVHGVHLVPPDFVAAQVRAVLDDIAPQAVKIGMIATAPIAAAIAGALSGRGLPLVLDPVMISTSGHRLIDEDAENALLTQLLPLATLLTPNRPEAARLLGSADPAAWVDAHGVALLAKDGHGEGDGVTDVLYIPGGGRIEMRHPRLRTRNTHGTGCTLAAAITARLARGEALEEAVPGAVTWLADQLAWAAPASLGRGHGPLLHGLAHGRSV
jgi:hydroxymethylpyrimidine/phosphomethylpyrimidine kinase